MLGVKLYPEFTLLMGATENDEKFLDVLLQVKECIGAQYVNFSVIDYQGNSSEMKHFLTYPMTWITHYVKNTYQDIDPLLSIDYRRVAHINWEDLWCSNDENRFYMSSLEFGIGEKGLSFTTNLGEDTYGILSMVFDDKSDNWSQFRKQNLAQMRLQTEIASNEYLHLFTGTPTKSVNLTQRELECLHWIALGKTDAQMSDIIQIGRSTVNTHVKSLIGKLKVPNRAAAVAKALSTGLLEMNAVFEM